MSNILEKDKKRFEDFQKIFDESIQKPEELKTFEDYFCLARYAFENACYEYRFHNNINKFQSFLTSIPSYIFTSYKLALKSHYTDIEGWNWGDFYDHTTYIFIYYILSGKDFLGAKNLASWMLDNNYFEKMPNYEDRYCYGYCLLYLLANDSQFWPTYNKLKKKKNKKTIPYVKIYEGIVENSESLAQEGLDELVLVMNKNWEDEHTGFINTWALGLANLCRLHGVMVHESMQKVPKMLIPATEVKPQVPTELLVTPEEVKTVLEKCPELGQLPPK